MHQFCCKKKKSINRKNSLEYTRSAHRTFLSWKVQSSQFTSNYDGISYENVLDDEKVYNRKSLETSTRLSWGTQEGAGPSLAKAMGRSQVALGMRLPPCPSRAGSQNLPPHWWLTCPVSVSTALDTAHRPSHPPLCISFLPLSQNFYLCMSMIYSGTLKNPIPSWQPLYMFNKWLVFFTLLSSGQSQTPGIRCPLLLQTDMRTWKVKLWLLMISGLLTAQLNLRGSRHHNWPTSIGQGQYFRHCTACNTGVPQDIKFVGKRKVFMCK